MKALTTHSKLTEGLARRRQTPDDVGITNAVDDRYHPKISGSPEQNAEKKTDREDR